jgi:hypothetical protein
VSHLRMSRPSRSILRSALMAAVGAALITSIALAAGPDREFAPAPEDTFWPAGSGVCDFDVNLHVDVNDEYIKLWTDASGNLVMFAINGTFKVTATNLDTGASVDINASGPGLAIFDADGNAVVNLAQGHYLSLGGLTLHRGLVDFNSGESRGSSVSYCAAIS